MIRFIRGKLVDIEEGLITVEAGGIGYGVRVPQSVLGSLPPINEEVKIHTYFSVKEDSMELFGFLSSEDRSMFLKLLSVNGVGPKGALSILSVLTPDMLRYAVATGDTKSIQASPGIGRKTAERLILELKDKIDIEDILSKGSSNIDSGDTSHADMRYTAQSEAIEALISLGYTMSEARKAVSKVEVSEGMTADDVLKFSLKHLSF